MKIIVHLNGTDENPWHRWGLHQNPFPQIAKHEYQAGMMRLQKLGGDPIPNTDYIRETLKGFDPEFVDLLCKMYHPGEMVKFEVSWPDEELA
jgi:hypothetical protein